ncbi:MAG: hypothetical protein A2Z75_05745 [Chloroflexi bacterium RBG_13_50_10]|nr:MAG: hypothetical protein A2Z75_05745 [Chloroflexi bacterium RBG_13_50_10]
MLEESNKRDRAHITNLIGLRCNKTPTFALLIGAGASATSGAKTSSELIAEWRQRLYRQSKNEKPLAEWLKEQDWYEDEEEYPILFEKVYDQPSQRRNYIEECIRDATPSWGYIYLANIIALNYFNVVFTPNFDDLINEACCTYGGLRPLVCAHDSAVADIRVTSARPKIIKLHGDFLYDSIKTTLAETSNLETNMRDKLRQFGKEYGLVVIGYSGKDKSIMDTLEMLLSDSTEGYFPHGLYWCRRREDQVSKRLRRLMIRGKTYWVEIEGFDEFMAELHEGLALTLPDTVRDPYRATTERLNRFILPRKEAKHPIIQKDVKQVETQIKSFEQVISGQEIQEFDRLVPYKFLGDRQYARCKYRDALVYYEKALRQDPNDNGLMLYMVYSYVWTENFAKAFEISQKMIDQNPNGWEGYYSRGFSFGHDKKAGDAILNFEEALKHMPEKEALRYSVLASRANVRLSVGDWEGAFLDTEQALQTSPKSPEMLLNKSIALKALGKEKEAKEIVQAVLHELKETKEDSYRRACAFAALGNKKNMLEELKVAIDTDSRYRVSARSDPDFREYREDPGFQKLVY